MSSKLDIGYSLFEICFVIAVLLAAAYSAAAKEIGPDADLCAAINALQPGEELVLKPGEYEGPCVIRAGGLLGEPVIIRAKDLAEKPRIVYEGRKANVLEVAAGYVTIRGLAFGPTRAGVDAIRIRSGEGITVEDCDFEGLGGAALASSGRRIRGITIRRNQVLHSRATAFYIGCHDGKACATEDLLFERNYVDGVDAAEGEIGYGIQIKLNSTAHIVDNVILNTKGPGIMVYGATVAGRTSTVERNAVGGSRRSGAIVIGGGPAIVRNNIATDSAEGGIQLENYGRRNLLRRIAVLHNTVYGNGGGITVPGEGPLQEIWLINNAVHGRPGALAFPGTGSGIMSRGNVDCTAAPCFRGPEARDFSPRAASPLIGAAFPHGVAAMPDDDFLGRPRAPLPTVGALEGSAPPVPVGFKSPMR